MNTLTVERILWELAAYQLTQKDLASRLGVDPSTLCRALKDNAALERFLQRYPGARAGILEVLTPSGARRIHLQAAQKELEAFFCQRLGMDEKEAEDAARATLRRWVI